MKLVLIHQTVCDITEIQMLSSAQPAPTGSGPISYQWEIRPVATGNWAPIDGATSEILTPTVIWCIFCFQNVKSLVL